MRVNQRHRFVTFCVTLNIPESCAKYIHIYGVQGHIEGNLSSSCSVIWSAVTQIVVTDEVLAANFVIVSFVSNFQTTSIVEYICFLYYTNSACLFVCKFVKNSSKKIDGSFRFPQNCQNDLVYIQKKIAGKKSMWFLGEILSCLLIYINLIT